MREIRTHRSMWRELETESRTGLRHRQLAKAVGNSYFPGLKITAPVPDPTEDDEPLVRQESVDGVGEVSPDLHHPAFVRPRRDPYDLDPARRQLDHEENIERDETTQAPDLDSEKVGSREHVPVGLEELAPRRSLAPFRSGVDSIPFQDVGDSRPANPMTDVVERTLDSSVSPWRLIQPAKAATRICQG